MKTIVRIAHLTSSGFISLVVVLSAALDFYREDFYYEEWFKRLYHYVGLFMIVSGVWLIFIMKKKHPTPEERVWASFFSFKFILSITLTPFTVRHSLMNTALRQYFVG